MKFKICLMAGIAAVGVCLLRAEDPPKRPLFLPKSPVAAAYILGRLSNQELIEAPRSEFVYVALLQRKGLDRKYRVEALNGLAMVRNSDYLGELIRGISELDQKGESSEPVLRELGMLLVQAKQAELAGRQDALLRLATEAQQPVTRQSSYAAMLTVEGSADELWRGAESNPAALVDLVHAMGLVRDAGIRAGFYGRVESLVQADDRPELRRAAIAVLPAIPGDDGRKFKMLAGLIKGAGERRAAIASMQRIPRKSWSADEADGLVQSLIAYLKEIPMERRTEGDAVAALQLASDLASLLPAEQARLAGRTLRGLGVSVFVIRAIPEQMMYDRTLIVVEAGKPVEIVLQNDDAMPHNLVVTVPGAVEEIGLAAEKMPLTPDSEGRIYVPNSPAVLHATKMLEPGQETRLTFTAPSEIGEYPYVCTFPGHWRRMVGTMAVVTDVEDYLASRAEVAEPVFTEWTVDQLASDLAKVGAGRNLAKGADLFTKLACAQCHRLGREGYEYGPELGAVLAQYRGDRREFLQQILEPSLVIADRYRNYEFELADGDTVFGMILGEDAETVKIQTGASDALVQVLKKSDIKTRTPQPGSAMPVGLLNLLSKEEIFDLLAYIEAGTKAPDQHHHP